MNLASQVGLRLQGLVHVGPEGVREVGVNLAVRRD